LNWTKDPNPLKFRLYTSSGKFLLKMPLQFIVLSIAFIKLLACNHLAAMYRLLFLFSLAIIFSCNSNKTKTNIVVGDDINLTWAVNHLQKTIETKSLLSIPKINIKSTSRERKDEGYILKVSDEISITGNDRNGAIYGILELSEQIKNASTLDDITSKNESARFPFRALKVNLPWDSYRRSEALELHMQTMQDISFWENFLDMMAENRFNTLTLWNLHPFNYMIRPTNFPDACGFDDTELKKWQNFWNSLFRMAKERGIDTYIVNWNIFVSPEFAENYKVAEYSKGGTFFTDGDTSEIVKKYTKECVTQLIDEYPDLTGLGITLGEGMGAMTPVQREEWLLETIIAGARKASRKIKFIHRVPLSANKGSGGSTDKSVEVMTRETLDTLTCFETPIWTEFKFNWSHAHSSTKLVKVHGGPLTDTYWNPPPSNYSINWMMRNEDIFILRWGQSEFIKSHIKENGHDYVGGYYVGSECYYPAVDYFTKADQLQWKYAFERQWLFYKQWGRLLYNPETSDKIFEDEFALRYLTDGKIMFQASELAGKVPLEIAKFWNGTWDFTLYSEGFLAKYNDGGTTLIPLSELIRRTPLEPDYISIKDYVSSLDNASPSEVKKTNPHTLASRIEADCFEVLKLIEPINPGENIAWKYELSDLKIWANLGLYFAEKLRAGVAFETYKQKNMPSKKKEAIVHIEKAADYWEKIVSISVPIYNEVPLVHLNGTEDTYFHWSKYTPLVREEINWVKNN